ncbi:MAG: hypothetical protein KC766_03020 [Myxococcales bacterium]|nr:hypothetical protein [Myxococcales bacterium]
MPDVRWQEELPKSLDASIPQGADCLDRGLVVQGDVECLNKFLVPPHGLGAGAQGHRSGPAHHDGDQSPLMNPLLSMDQLKLVYRIK